MRNPFTALATEGRAPLPSVIVSKLFRPDPGDSPPPAVPPQQPTETVDANTEGGLDRVDPGADERGAADGRAPAVFARAAAIASQADTAAAVEAVEVVDAALDHSSHRDRAGGRRITVSTRTLFKNFRRRWTNWQARLAGHLDLIGDNIAQWSRRASRPVQIDPTSPSSERPSSSLTTFDPKSLVVN